MNTAIPPPEALYSGAERACRLLKVLSNPDRLMILCELAQGECRVGELETRLGIGQPTLSQQLTVLRAEELVDTRREGRHIHYRLISPQVGALIGVLHEQFCQSTETSQ